MKRIAFLFCLFATCAHAGEIDKLLASGEHVDKGPSIESLMSSGWQLVGTASTSSAWATFLVFKHPDRQYLTQCRAGYDVTRTPHVMTFCYEVH